MYWEERRIRIYTRGGDTGETGLLGGDRVRKDDVRLQAIGDLDELNATLGWTVVICGEHEARWLVDVQVRLFDLGAELASAPGGESRWQVLAESHVHELEALIDHWESELTPLRHFILPGGTELAARLHIARAVARRAERSLVALHDRAPVRPVVLQYLNRLSDALFVAARRANATADVGDTLYRSEGQRP